MNKVGCLEHMRITGHRNMMEPMYVTCYACPQCLMLFSSKDDAFDHMYKESHKAYQYAFKGRYKSREEDFPVREKSGILNML